MVLGNLHQKGFAGAPLRHTWSKRPLDHSTPNVAYTPPEKPRLSLVLTSVEVIGG